MFTGIVQGIARIDEVVSQTGLSTLRIQFPQEHLHDVRVGASVAIDGTCLTVTGQQGDCLLFDVMQETLGLTTLGQLTPDDKVNFERAARIGDEIGGHLLSGHIHATATVVAIERPENNCTLTFELPEHWVSYIFPKGFIAVNGASLTVGTVENNRFNVHLIPETLRATTFSDLVVNDSVNIEIDSQTQTIVDTLDRLGYSRPER